ncbi:MAG: hypothetical protein M3P11_04240 [Actinomycetota bacterium]|nr:hypothetical protein [Actinomycetota bacterium]
MRDPTGRLIALPARSSRCGCTGCGFVFASEDAFDRHRVGRYEPDERRCLTPEEWPARGLHTKPSGVVGRYAQKPNATGNTATAILKAASLAPTACDLPDTHLRYDIASAVAKPHGQALVIDENNRSNGWTPILDAIQTGICFAVDVAFNIIALDADSCGQSRAIEAIADFLIDLDIEPVVLASGGVDRSHLFACITDEALLYDIKERARGRGVDVRRFIRPPASPHRQGLPVALLRPKTWDGALRALTPQSALPAPGTS